jgi:hypothetical protein
VWTFAVLFVVKICEVAAHRKAERLKLKNIITFHLINVNGYFDKKY